MPTLLQRLLLFTLLLISTQALEARMVAKLEAGDKVFYNVIVRKVQPDSIIIQHKDGLAKVPMELLPPEWQKQLGYNPEVAEAYREAQQEREERIRAQQEAEARAIAEKKATLPKEGTVADRVLPLFGTTPRPQQRVDMRPEFQQYDLYAKDQGRRPSCSVFSVVSALEFQLARNRQQPERLSEEYLIWATRKSLGMEQAVLDDPSDLTGDDDLGFTIMEVVQALRAYGIVTADDMPNTFGKRMAEIDTPDADAINAARQRQEVYAYQVTGRSNTDRLQGIVHLLNEGVPVVIGLAWPHYRSLRSPLLSRQTPREGSAHAVTLVGYKCENGRLMSARFLFKNSWGPGWGNGGYGWVTWEYLDKHLYSAFFLDCK